MLRLKKLLVPTDFSKGARSAYPYAEALTKRFGGKIDFIHIIPMLKYLNESISRLGLPLDMDKDVYPHIQTDAMARLKEELKMSVSEASRGDAIVKVDRKASDTIVEYAAKKSYDLIVMGARGSHEHDLFKGSITEKVIRGSSIPVLTVHNGLSGRGIKRILVPTDYSELSFKSLKYAVSMASNLEAEITLFHVVELYGSESENEDRDPGKGEIEAIHDNLVAKVKKHIDENILGDEKWKVTEEGGQLYLTPVKNENGRKIIFNVLVKKGIGAHYEIVELADEESDLVVMATHGRSGLSHLFLGSTTEKVIMSSRVPVLTIRPEKKVK
ncbi:MAG: universal stress protein [Balneolaceae bacterium]|nr:MAG: universal stress protein [Balneolaceae bacterium]